MKISVTSKIPVCDALCVFLPEKKFDAKVFGKLLPKPLVDEILARMGAGDFTGKFGEVFQIFVKNISAKKILLIGAGKKDDKLEQRKISGLAVRAAKKQKCKSVAFLFSKNFDVLRIASGAILGAYEFKIGDISERFEIQKMQLVTEQKISKSELDAEISAAEATNFTRELVNLPSNFATIDFLVGEAKKIAKTKNISLKILDRKKLEKLGMGGVLGVAQGSDQEARVAILEFSNGKKSDAPIALVGKGVVFDSGGYNLKPVNHIETMHQDMAGAATVLGAFRWLADAQPKKNVVGVLGLVENSISGHAYRPGDILKMSNGKTVHVTNTDAEGRLVLADCLHFVSQNYKPAQIFDFATLTGAVVAALGTQITGVMGNDKKLLKEFSVAAEKSDELVWELPITDFFREKVKAEQADLQNWTAGVNAGSSMAGAFLQEFVGKKIDWLHVDIAGTAFNEKSGDELSPRGATGAIVRTVCEFLKKS
ncbi:leucyl aminopeptidase [bacterium]|jgi:leucyl aminopeptidase|nr:leucyl aminopeptidase [bacterium]MBT6831694.1 leucyl aminopeptidase [bacterium]MBT6996674.1 leucyl aminopeptidase [bacterium]MBT7772843.1 leucyl aminopeptidase [bacterium]